MKSKKTRNGFIEHGTAEPGYSKIPVETTGKPSRDLNLVNSRIFQGPKTNLRALREVICQNFGVTEEALTGRSRLQSIVTARKIFAARARLECGASLTEIGLALGGRDHSTIIHYLKTIKSM